MNEVYVVVGEFGEYEDRNKAVCGVFPTLEEALEGIADANRRRPIQWRLREEWDGRRKAFLETLTPVGFIQMLSGGVFKSYRNEDYAKAEVEAGAKPSTIFPAETLTIYRLPFGQWADESEEIQTVTIDK